MLPFNGGVYFEGIIIAKGSFNFTGNGGDIDQHSRRDCSRSRVSLIPQATSEAASKFNTTLARLPMPL